MDSAIEAAVLADTLGASEIGQPDAATWELAARVADDVGTDMRRALEVLPAALRETLPPLGNPMLAIDAEELAEADPGNAPALKSLADLARLGFELWRHGVIGPDDELAPKPLTPQQVVEFEARLGLHRGEVTFMERIERLMCDHGPELRPLPERGD